MFLIVLLPAASMCGSFFGGVRGDSVAQVQRILGLRDALCVMVKQTPSPVATLDGDPGIVTLLLRAHGRSDGEPKRVLATFEFGMTLVANLDGPFTLAQWRVWDIEDNHKYLYAAGSSEAWPQCRDRTVKLEGGLQPTFGDDLDRQNSARCIHRGKSTPRTTSCIAHGDRSDMAVTCLGELEHTISHQA
jgi:hypothetical protein